ncbi:MAG TPA: twin transmembrane helix small protein [Rhodocyclaceae bacterium]|nr:twin transmembrane helix small protein [Rhodocyclaceae bacterium]
MVFKALVVLMLLAVIGSLFSGLVFLYRDKGAGSRVVKALTLRISLSILLFIGLWVAFYFQQHGAT